MIAFREPGAVKYSLVGSSMDYGMQLIKNEGFASLFKGAGRNIRGVTGAGVLAGYDQLKYYYVLYRYGEEAAKELKRI
jgi:hypothetical protein